jgi:hypothetical protein
MLIEIILGVDSRNRHWVVSNCFMVCVRFCVYFYKVYKKNAVDHELYDGNY